MHHRSNTFHLIFTGSFLVFFLCTILMTNAKAGTNMPYRILVISSYDYSSTTVPLHLNGFAEGLGDLYVDVTYEFMDAKRLYNDSNTADFYSYLSNKINHSSRYDLVVLMDDTALHFGLDYADDLFPGVPIVFMGVNNIREAHIAASQDNVTGIAEVLDIEDNISLSSELFPDDRQYVVITDNSNTAEGEYIEFEKYAALHPELNYRTINIGEYSQVELREVLSEIDENSIIIYFDCLRDGGRNIYTLESAIDLISECAPMVPIWRMSVPSTVRGIFGGLTYSYKDSGIKAGEIAAKILTGTPPSEIPLVTDSVSEGLFDQYELDKYNIKISQLPPDSVILHEHRTFYKFYRENTILLNLVLLIVFLMIVIIVLLLAANRHKKLLIHQDFLTKIPNRTFITERISSASESGEAFGIVMMDVDKFKTINDTLGHLVGDELLVGVAKRLKSLSTKEILIARIGGDEFIGLIRNADKAKADQLCKDIVDIMRSDFESSAGPLHITVSLGCALYPLDTDRAISVMGLADDALYDVKEHGRDGYRLYSDLKSTSSDTRQ